MLADKDDDFVLLSEYPSYSQQSLLSKRIIIRSTIPLTNDGSRLYFTSRYRQICFKIHSGLSLKRLADKIFSFIIVEADSKKIYGFVVCYEDKFNFKIISAKEEATIEYSSDLKGNPNYFISKYDYFIKLSFSFFSKILFLKESVSKTTIFWSSAKINDYIFYKDKFYRVINIIYKTIYSTPYRSFESECEDDSIDTKKKEFLTYKLRKFEIPKHRFYIVYDCETIPDVKNKRHYMYCLGACAFAYTPSYYAFKDVKLCLSREFFEERNFMINLMNEITVLTEDVLVDVNHRVAEEFTKYCIKIINEEYYSLLDNKGRATYELEVHILGYNNRNFDDHYIIDDFLRTIQYYSSEIHKREMKIVSHRVSSYDILINKSSIDIFFDDVIVWLPEISSLKVACKELEVDLSKVDFNIVKFNDKCLDKGSIINEVDLDEFLSLWKGDYKRLDMLIKRAKKSEREFDNFLDEFMNVFSLDPGLTKITDKISLDKFIAYYCIYDVYATAEIFLKMAKAFSICMQEIYKDNLLEDKVILSSFNYNEITSFSDDVLKRKVIEVPYLNFSYLSMSSYLTPSQASYTIFKFMYEDNFKINNDYNPGLQNVINDAFFGGLVLYGGIGKFISKINQVDVRSEYPLSACGPMPLLNNTYTYKQNLSNKHVDNLNKKIVKAIAIRNNHFMTQQLHKQSSISEIYSYIDFLGIYQCKVTPPSLYNISMISPLILAVRGPSGSRKVDTFNIPFTKFFTTAHIKTFILFGWNIKILHNNDNVQFLFNLSTDTFEMCYQEKFCYLRKFISFFNDKKASAPNKVMKKFYKALMNLLCGRLAMRSDCLTTTFKEKNTRGAGYSSSLNKVKPDDSNKSDKWLAIFITTSAHNIILSKIYLLELGQIYKSIPLHLREPVLIYCDTDSMYYDPKTVLPDIEFELSDELGNFNLSKFDYDVTWTSKFQGKKDVICYVLFKKGYILCETDGRIIDFKNKGIPNSDLKSVFYNTDGKLNQNSIDLLFTDSISIPINRLTNKQDMHNLQKKFFNISIVKKLKIESIGTGDFDFSWKPAIDKNNLKLTHSSCSVCDICKDWYLEIKKHPIYFF